VLGKAIAPVHAGIAVPRSATIGTVAVVCCPSFIRVVILARARRRDTRVVVVRSVAVVRHDGGCSQGARRRGATVGVVVVHEAASQVLVGSMADPVELSVVGAISQVGGDLFSSEQKAKRGFLCAVACASSRSRKG